MKYQETKIISPENSSQSTERARNSKFGKVMLKVFTFGGVGLAAAAAGVGMSDRITNAYNGDPNSFSTETTEHVTQRGEGVLDAVRHIDGIEKTDDREAVTYVKHMEQNKKVFANGKLEEGEKVVIPVSTE